MGGTTLILTPLPEVHSLETSQPATDATVSKSNQVVLPRVHCTQGQGIETPEKQDQALKSSCLNFLESQKHVLGSSSHSSHSFWCKWNSKASAIVAVTIRCQKDVFQPVTEYAFPQL